MEIIDIRRKTYTFIYPDPNLWNYTLFGCTWAQIVSWYSSQMNRYLVVRFRGRIFSRVRPFYEQAMCDLDRSMHRSLWA